MSLALSACFSEIKVLLWNGHILETDADLIVNPIRLNALDQSKYIFPEISRLSNPSAFEEINQQLAIRNHSFECFVTTVEGLSTNAILHTNFTKISQENMYQDMFAIYQTCFEQANFLECKSVGFPASGESSDSCKNSAYALYNAILVFSNSYQAVIQEVHIYANDELKLNEYINHFEVFRDHSSNYIRF